VTVGDFNGDGIADLAVANDFNPGSLSVFLGHGDGTFAPAQTYATSLYPSSVVAGDVNGDGIVDLLATSFEDATGAVNVLLGRGDGTFAPAQTYAAGPYPTGLMVADFNGDGLPDLAVANANNEEASVLLGRGDGTFAAPQSYAAGPSPGGLAVGDFNGDGLPDLALANNVFPGAVTVLLNAADWPGGHPPRAVPPHHPRQGRTVLPRPGWNVLVTAADLCPSLTATGAAQATVHRPLQPPTNVRVVMATSSDTRPAMPRSCVLLATTRQAADVDFAGWLDPVVDDWVAIP
jgi:hypothetical protein